MASMSTSNKKKKKIYCTTKMSQSHLKTSAGMKSARNLFKCGRSVCSWQVCFCLARQCVMQSAHAQLLKAPYKAPSVRAHHHSLLEPQNPLTAPKWLLLLFVSSSRLLINDHIQPLYGTWQAYGFFFLKGLMRKTTHHVGVHLEGIL